MMLHGPFHVAISHMTNPPPTPLCAHLAVKVPAVISEHAREVGAALLDLVVDRDAGRPRREAALARVAQAEERDDVGGVVVVAVGCVCCVCCCVLFLDVCLGLWGCAAR